jgi:uncharacterized protein (TIGR02466 family)
MDVIPIFSTPLFQDTLEINNQELVEHAYYLQRNFKDDRNTERGYQSTSFDLGSKNVKPLLDQILVRINIIKTDCFGIYDKANLSISNGWVNISYPNGGNCFGNEVPHLHPLRFLSCVYYAKAEENSGNLILMSPVPSAEYSKPIAITDKFNQFNSTRWVVNPEEGKLVLFPGWLMHFVEPNFSNDDRISFVFNISIDNVENLVNR